MEVSKRTIYRDIEALGMAGIPVYAERGPGGGCTLLDGYQTRLTGLTEAEIRALFLLNMTHPLADLGLDKALDDALLKLSAALPAAQRQEAEQVRQRIYLDTTTPQSSQPITQHQQGQQKKLCFAPVPRQTKQKKEFLNPSLLPEQKKALNPSVFSLKKQKMKLSPRKKPAFSFV